MFRFVKGGGKKRMSDSKARFFLPPDDYEILRFGGESVKDEEKGIKQMMKYYHDFGLTEEQLRENNKKYSFGFSRSHCK